MVSDQRGHLANKSATPSPLPDPGTGSFRPGSSGGMEIACSAAVGLVWCGVQHVVAVTALSVFEEDGREGASEGREPLHPLHEMVKQIFGN